MRTFLRSIFVLYFVSRILCLSKQVFITDHMDIVEIDEDYVQASGEIQRINKTNIAVNVNFSIMHDLRPVSVDISLFAMQNNVYRPTALAIRKTLCEIWNLEFKKIERKLRKHSYFPESCHLEEGDYYIRNYIPDTIVYPFSKSPWSKVKFRFRFYFTGTDSNLAVVDVTAHVDEAVK